MRSKGDQRCEVIALGKKDVEDSCGKQEFLTYCTGFEVDNELSSGSSEAFTYVLSL